MLRVLYCSVLGPGCGEVQLVEEQIVCDLGESSKIVAACIACLADCECTRSGRSFTVLHWADFVLHGCAC